MADIHKDGFRLLRATEQGLFMSGRVTFFKMIMHSNYDNIIYHTQRMSHVVTGIHVCHGPCMWHHTGCVLLVLPCSESYLHTYAYIVHGTTYICVYMLILL